MTDSPSDPSEPVALAGELALRLLSPAEEAQARARAAADPAFAAERDAWNEHLAGLADEIAPVAPSARLWPRIQAAISDVANDNGRLVFWRNWAVGSTGLLAASLAAVAVMLSQPAPVAPPAPAQAPTGGVTRVATLALEDGAPAVTLAYDTVTGKLFISPTRQMAGGTAVPHLWLVMPEGGVQLVGAIDGAHAATHSLNQALNGMAGQAQAVAISMEAPGHVPGANKPDGPVIASGELQRL